MNDSIVLITGSEGGIGKTLVRELLRFGYFVIASDLYENSFGDEFHDCDRFLGLGYFL